MFIYVFADEVQGMLRDRDLVAADHALLAACFIRRRCHRCKKSLRGVSRYVCSCPLHGGRAFHTRCRPQECDCELYAWDGNGVLFLETSDVPLVGAALNHQLQ